MLHQFMTKVVNNPFNINVHNKFNKVQHITVNFVDDSTNIIGFIDHNEIKNYITQYYELLHVFYTANKLKINSDKSKYFINCRPKLLHIFKNFFFMARNHKIKPVSTLKILGYYLRSDLHLDSQIGKLSATLHNRIFQIKKLTKFTNFKTRATFIKAYVIGKVIYAIPLYMSANSDNLKKLHKIIMAGARAIIGQYCPRRSIDYILGKCSLLDAKDLILYSTLCFYHRMMKRETPQALLKLYHTPHRRERNRKYRPLYLPKLKTVQNSFLYRGSEAFNKLPVEMKEMTHDKFKNTLKGYIAERELWNSND